MDEQNIQNQPYLTFFDADTAEYDVIVDQSSSAPNLKEATWGALQPLFPIIGDRMGPEEFALVLEYSPLPETFLEKFKAIQDQKAQQPPPPDPAMQKIQADQQIKEAELQFRQQEAQTELQIEQQRTQQQLELEKTKTAAQLELDAQKAAAQIQLEREKAAASLLLEQQKTQMSLQADRERMAFDQERMKSDTAMKHTAMKHEMALRAGSARVKMQQGSEPPESESEDDAGEGPDMEEMDLFGNKALAGSMEQMAQAIVQMAQANAESQRMMAEGIAMLGSELKDAMTKPKTIVRGPDGRAIGVQ